jgi:cytochrome o ubiquinol oxidase subunit 2
VLYGRSAHFSGDGFSDMDFQVHSVTPTQFAAWAQGAKGGTGQMLDQAAYAQLAKQSQKVPPITFRGVDPQLFQAIAAQTLPPAPGPEPENPSHAGREVSTGGRH